MEHPDHRRRGYAKEAAAALVQFAFDAGLRVVRAHTRLDDEISSRVLTACNFERIGEITDAEDGVVWRWETRATPPSSAATG